MIRDIYKYALDESAIVAITNAKGEITYVNEKFCIISGYTEAELLGQDHRILNSSYHSKSFFKQMWATIGKGNKWSAEVKNKNKQGGYYWVNTTIIPVMDKKNKPLEYIAIRFEITEKKKVEKELLQAYDILDKTNKIARIGSWTYDVEKQLFTISSLAKEILGLPFSLTTISKSRLLNFVGDRTDKMLFKKALETTLNKSTTLDIETQLIGKNKECCARIIGYAVTENNNCKFINGIVQDISEHKKQLLLQKEVVDLQKEKEISEHTTKEKELFLANMSHEIRTPLNAVLGLSNLLAKADNLTDTQSKYLKAILSNSKNLLSIINNILDYSKMEAGKINFEKTPFDLLGNVNDIVGSLYSLVADKGLVMNLNMPDNFPLKVIGDGVSINQIITNLLSNAIKFTHKGGITLAITVENESESDLSVRFSVKDTGIGIPDDKLYSVFELFTQASTSTTRKYGGTGLGLSIVKKLVEIQNGSIHINSKINEGTEFYFTLNYKKCVGEELYDVDNDTVKPINNIKILLVEDNEFNTMVATYNIIDWSPQATIDVAENGLEALQKLEVSNYDIILMDIHMPVMDGHAATTHIRNKFPHPLCDIPIIAMTARANSAKEIDICKESGMDEYISKPYDPKELFTKIHKVLTVKKKRVSVVNQDITISSSTSIVNTDIIVGFAKNNKERMEKMVNMFLRDMPNKLIELKEAISNNNYLSVKGIAHSTKPSYTYLGMAHLTEIAKQIESNAAAEKNIEETKSLIDKLTRQSERGFQELAFFLDKL